MEAKFAGLLKVRAAGESFDCCITGITMISRDIIVVADYYNNSVKVINVNKKAISELHQLSAAPWDVTAIDSKTVATTLPDKGQVEFLNIKNGRPEQDCLDVGKGCWGIDHNNGVIAVSFSSAIRIFNMSGKVLYELSIQHVLNSHSYVCLRSDGNIFVTDTENHTIHQLSRDGDQKAVVKSGDLKSPAGIISLRNGYIVVCGIGNNNRVTVIAPGTGDCKPLSMDNLHKPCCVTVCEENCKMYVTEDTTSVDMNYIKIYNVSF